MEKCDLEGVWLPTLHSKWRNGFPHIPIPFWHAVRARMPQTKLTFDESGRGEGWVGESYIRQEATQISPGRYSSVAYVKHVWIMGDGHLTILPETGILEVQFPSDGVKEYWKREDGRSLEILKEAKARAGSEASAPRGEPRPVRLMFARNPILGVTWQWGLSIGESIYEATAGKEGRMTVLGPGGIVVGGSTQDMNPRWYDGTKWRGADGFVHTGKITNRTNAEIEEECRTWAREHLVWKAPGPNCRTFSEDLYEFLTGERLPFDEMANLMLGPTKRARVVWLRERNVPGDFAVENIITRWYQ